MKPLTLTVYPKSPSRPGPGKGWADWRRDRDRECKQAHEKRFTDAELAAEYHAARGFEPLMRVSTLARFARTPHYYEEQE